MGELPGRKESALEFEPQEYLRRWRRALAAMAELAIDAIVLSAPSSVRYFTGLRTWLWKPLIPTVAILARDHDSVAIVASAMDSEGVACTSWPADPRFYAPGVSPADAISSALVDLCVNSGRIGFELGNAQLSYLSAGVLADMRRALPRAHIVDAEPVASVVRMLKSEAEIERLRTAARITEHGFSDAFDAAHEGMTEAALARTAASHMVLSGSLPSFAPMTLICRAGPPSYPQLLQLPGEEPVRRNQQIFFDGGCEFRGYQTDIMRSAVIGRVTVGAEEHFALLDEAIAVAVAHLRPAVPLAHVRRAVEDFALSRGASLGDAIYGIGHGIGLDRWELPLITNHAPYGSITAREGMVLCVEPSLGIPAGETKHSGLFAMEDEVLVTSRGGEVLSSVSSRALRHLTNDES